MSPYVRGAGPRQETGPTRTKITHSESYALGLEQAITNDAADWWTNGARLALRQLARTGRGFTADHLLDMVGEPPAPAYAGAAFAAAQCTKIIEPVGCKVLRDGRLGRVWWGSANEWGE